jgi:methyl-accepting chemotaxis protein
MGGNSIMDNLIKIQDMIKDFKDEIGQVLKEIKENFKDMSREFRISIKELYESRNSSNVRIKGLEGSIERNTQDINNLGTKLREQEKSLEELTLKTNNISFMTKLIWSVFIGVGLQLLSTITGIIIFIIQKSIGG